MKKLDGVSRIANRVARAAGFGRATKIVFGTETRVISHTHYGHRKYTTGEYVSKAYLANFGWKNTYYQHAETVVQLCGADLLSGGAKYFHRL